MLSSLTKSKYQIQQDILGGGKVMVIDKSLYYYGNIYHILIDPLLRASWEQIVNVIPENSRIFDAGCGTGGLALLLRERKKCQVVGADLSLRMLDFASKLNPFSDVKFLHMDISNIKEYRKNSFDYAIMCQVIHEMPAGKQPEVIGELMRIGKKLLILDANTPLPINIVGMFIRLIDATLGRDHYDNYKSYIASGGIMGILERAGLIANVVQRLIFRSGCQQIVVLGR
jgi:ubiquinone/menaquinone biosynthesis C-methylase UbiE